jgi:hypothetical protein
MEISCQSIKNRQYLLFDAMIRENSNYSTYLTIYDEIQSDIPTTTVHHVTITTTSIPKPSINIKEYTTCTPSPPPPPLYRAHENHEQPLFTQPSMYYYENRMRARYWCLQCRILKERRLFEVKSYGRSRRNGKTGKLSISLCLPRCVHCRVKNCNAKRYKKDEEEDGEYHL